MHVCTHRLHLEQRNCNKPCPPEIAAMPVTAPDGRVGRGAGHFDRPNPNDERDLTNMLCSAMLLGYSRAMCGTLPFVVASLVYIWKRLDAYVYRNILQYGIALFVTCDADVLCNMIGAYIQLLHPQQMVHMVSIFVRKSLECGSLATLCRSQGFSSGVHVPARFAVSMDNQSAVQIVRNPLLPQW
jgi:hypothetical protein